MRMLAPAALAVAMLAAGSDIVTRAAYDGWRQPRDAAPHPATIVVDEGPGPSSLRALVAKSDLIVRGRIGTPGAPEALAGARAPLAVRYSPVVVLETLKSAAPDSVRLMQFGGTIAADDRVVETRNPVALDFPPGGQSVLFLKKHPAVDAYVLVSSLVGVYRLDDDGRSVSLPADARQMPELFGRRTMTADELRAAIARAGR
ncbi:MAG TPA: hypothetical protein VLT86_10265 [Vicinamibacterales bacterium]|nr:hypothetical protein [Vicinamibacterales bacterium]